MKEYPTPRPLPGFAGMIQGPPDMAATVKDVVRGKWQDVADDVPPTVCIRHGRHVPCRNDKYSCLLSSNGSMVAMVDAYQANTDGVRWDFEHVVKSWIYMQKKGEGNW
jgi:hypothetical protein